MEETEKNDFNRHVSRYVSTVEAEIEIYLAEVHAKLAALDQTITTTTQLHNELMDPLGLPRLSCPPRFQETR